MEKFSFEGKCDLSFAILSDLHMTHRGEGLQKLHQHFALYAKAVPALDLHVFAGDIVYQHDLSGGGSYDKVESTPYEYLRIVREKYAKDIPLVYAIGNHEYPQHNWEDDISRRSREMFTSYGYPLCDHQVVKGYHFITIPIQNYHEAVLPEDEAWAEHEIRCALRASGDLPVFVVYHVPIDGTVCGAHARRFSDKFRAFLLSSRRIINICGHLHTAVEQPTTIWQRRGGATVFHAPMSATGFVNARGCDNAHLYGSSLYNSRSVFVEVTGRRVLLHKIDNITEREIGEPWVVDLDGEQFYTDARKTRAKKPAFAEGVTVEAVRQTAGGVFFKFPKALCEETAGNDDSAVPNYRFAFFKKGEKTPVKTVTWHSDYVESYPGTHFEDTVIVTLTPGAYSVTITPISFFGKEGRPIRVKLKMGEAIPVPHNPVYQGWEAYPFI
ncbi:MAG: hypothetical protein E7609_01970 [Ruminococcaceae bacterium]|nr:hypothetical protein [Oscillospiraceae bacterium]